MMRRPRPIDRQRDGGGQAELDPASGAILFMVSADRRLYIVSERAISSVQMADQIDPERLNAELPQFVQRQEIAYGAATPIIQRTICIGGVLFNQTHLPVALSKDDAFLNALTAARDLAEVSDTVAELGRHEAHVRDQLARGAMRRGVIPTTPNLRGRTTQAIAHLRSVQIAAVALCDMFYPRERSNMAFTETFLATVRARLADDDPAIGHFEDCLAVMDRIKDHRHAMIHQDHEKRLTVFDYQLRADGTLVAPTVEIVHPRNALDREDTVAYLLRQQDELSLVYETLVALLCDRNAREVNRAVSSAVVPVDDADNRGSRFRWHTSWKPGFPLQPGDIVPDELVEHHRGDAAQQ